MDRAPMIWRPADAVQQATLSPAATRLAVLDHAGTLTIFAVDRQQPLAHLQAPPDTRAIALSDDGDALAVVDANLRIHVLHPTPGHSLEVRCGSRSSVGVQPDPPRERFDVDERALTFAPDGRAVLALSHELEDWEYYYGGGTVDTQVSAWLVQWPAGSAECLHHERGSRSVTYHVSDQLADAAPIMAAAFSPGGQWIALQPKRGPLLLRGRDAAGPALAWGPREHAIDAFAFAPGDAELIVVSGRRVSTWEIVGGREIASFEASTDIEAVAAGRDRLACLDAHGDVTVYTREGVAQDQPPRVAQAPVRLARWLGERLVLLCRDGSLVL